MLARALAAHVSRWPSRSPPADPSDPTRKL